MVPTLPMEAFDCCWLDNLKTYMFKLSNTGVSSNFEQQGSMFFANFGPGIRVCLWTSKI